jgi:pimeloyl-ACP methyl ester carboxylesterase
MAVDGFELAYDRVGSGPAVVLLHGWPGDRTDYRDLVPLLSGCEVVVPDLRGFGHSDKHLADPARQYSGPAQARSVADLITSLGIAPDFTVSEEHLDHLVSVYGPPGAFTASVQWYRSGARTTTTAASETAPAPEDRLATPAVVLWPEHDPLFPREWSDRIDAFFSRARLRFVDGAGHYAPLEYPSVIAEEVRGFLAG